MKKEDKNYNKLSRINTKYNLLGNWELEKDSVRFPLTALNNVIKSILIKEILHNNNREGNGLLRPTEEIVYTLIHQLGSVIEDSTTIEGDKKELALVYLQTLKSQVLKDLRIIN